MTRLFGVVGFPVDHSLSPAMHNAAFRRLGLDALYAPFEVPPAALKRVLTGLVACGVEGLNVTVPLKERVVPLLDDLSPAAREIGAVNTIIVRRGRCRGDNTDPAGFSTALRRELGLNVRRQSAVVLGAGGTAKAVVWALLRHGCRHVTIANRTPARAARLVRALQRRRGRSALRAVPLDSAALCRAVRDAGLLVNATSVGMRADDPPLVAPESIHGGLAVFDCVYGSRPSALVRSARRRGALAVDGLTMLLYQGAASFRLWWKYRPPLDVMRQVLERSLRSRMAG